MYTSQALTLLTTLLHKTPVNSLVIMLSFFEVEYSGGKIFTSFHRSVFSSHKTKALSPLDPETADKKKYNSSKLQQFNKV
jgi:hypothetical protein